MKDCDIIDEGIRLYKDILFPPKIYGRTALSPLDKLLWGLKIEIEDLKCPGYPDRKMNETCEDIFFRFFFS